MDNDTKTMEDIKEIKDEVKDLHDNLNTVMSDMKQVKEALLGNDYNKVGIVQSVAEHHLRLTSLERQLERGKWLVIGLSAGSGVGIYEIIKNFIL